MSDKNFKVKNGIDANGAVTITQPNTSTVPLTILANTLATGSNLLEIKRPDGTVRLSIGNDGAFSSQNLVAYNVRFYSTNSGSQPLILRGQSSQTANLQEWRDVSENILAKVDASGSITAADLTLSGNLTVNGTTTNLNSTNLVIEDKNIIIADVATPTDTTADGAGITIKGATDKTLNWVQSTGSFTSSEPLRIITSNTSSTTLVVKASPTYPAQLQEWQNSSGTTLAQIGYNGNASFYNIVPFSNSGTYVSFGSGAVGFISRATNTPTVTVNGISSQTANLQEWQLSSGTVAASISAYGDLIIPGSRVAIGSASLGENTVLHTVAATASYVPIVAKGASSQTANLTEWQNSSGTVLAKVGIYGDAEFVQGGIVLTGGSSLLVTNNIFSVYGKISTGNGVNTPPAQLTTFASSASTIGLIVRAAASQTANIFEVQDSTGYPYFKIDSGFNINNLGSLSIFSNRIGSAMLSLTPGYFGNVGAVIRGMSGQTADLQQWQNSAGTNMAIVDATGNITDASNTKWLSPIGSGSNDAPTIQALIDAGKKEIRLGSGQWTFSTRIKIPNGVTVRGIGTSTTTTTGTRVNTVALIASEGTVRDITFTGAGENSQSELGGGIAVLGGRIIDCSVTDSRYVLAPTRQPHGYLKNFMSKMQSGYGSVRIAVLGDSLSENTSTTSWYGYLFNSATTATGYYLGSYFSHQIAPSEVDNMAIGGQGAYLLSAQLAMTKETLRTGDYVNQVLDGDRVSPSPFFNRDYNLAILAIGQNGGEDWKAHLEYTVKTIRDKGIDVVILTQNPAASNPTSRAGDEYFYRSMAETYGCLLVDTQAYFRLEVEFGRALGTTADLFGDSIHQSALGHQLYAKAILNALLDYDSTAAVPANKTVVSRSYLPAQTDRAAAIAGLNSYYLVKRPDSLRGISGVTYTTATDTSIRNPIYGRGTTTNSVTTIASGGYATWGVEYANAAYIIYRENSTANTLTVAIQAGGSTLATLTTGVTNGRTSVQKVTLAGGYPANRPIRITNTSGNAIQIYGVVFETHADVAFNRNTDGSYAGVKLNGAWSYSDFLSMASYSGYLTPHTSTTNDSVTFKFYGDGLRFATSYGKNSGIIQVKIDDTTYTAVDTYNNIGEYGVYTHFYGGLEYGLHTATITLTGANASVTGLTSDGARFGLHRISAVRSEWYLTQDQQFNPNSDTSSIVNSVSSIRMGSVGGANIATFYNGTSGYGAGAITSTGTFNINGANMGFPYTSSGATLNVNAGSSSTVPLTVKAVSGQTANLQEWYNGAGQSIASISPYSEFFILGNSYFAGASDYGARINISSSIASKIGLVVRGVASQTADLQQWQDSSGYVSTKITAAGTLRLPIITDIAGTGSLFYMNTTNININTRTATNVGLMITGVASQTADLQQWQNSGGTVLTRIGSDGAIYRGATTVDSFGAIYTSETVAIGANAGQRFATGGMTIINRESVSSIIFGVKGITSQTGDLTQWRNSSDTVLAKVDALGNFSAISKSFDIQHPTKENMRLRYASLEGPENGVYIRGTAESNVIELPDYWTGLVHEDSITVSLTSVGSAQNIYVEKIENNKVYIGGELTKTFFTVYGERKDIDNLTVEY